MLSETGCEVCGWNNWEFLGRRVYTKSETVNYSHYVKKRYRVLFEKWIVGKDRVTLTSSVCRRCGFIVYFPRPEKQDIDAKYRFLEEMGQDYGGNVSHDSNDELKRSKNLYRFLKKYINLHKVNKILDYGGGDGRLMYIFRKRGKQCYLIDYNKSPVQGISKLGDTIDQLAFDEKFDLIICSHVIEHVAEPSQVLQKLLGHLNKGGYIYIQVPMEVWKRPPFHIEPVTHINFFTPNSLYNLMVAGGLIVHKCKLSGCLYPSGFKGYDVRAIGSRMTGEGKKNQRLFRKPDAVEYIKPKVVRTLHYSWCVSLSNLKIRCVRIFTTLVKRMIKKNSSR
jgi:SAM-dependent methyltransferase